MGNSVASISGATFSCVGLLHDLLCTSRIASARLQLLLYSTRILSASTLRSETTKLFGDLRGTLNWPSNCRPSVSSCIGSLGVGLGFDGERVFEIAPCGESNLSPTFDVVADNVKVVEQGSRRWLGFGIFCFKYLKLRSSSRCSG